MRLKLSLMLAAALISATPTAVSAQYTLNVRDADIRAFIQDARAHHAAAPSSSTAASTARSRSSPTGRRRAANISRFSSRPLRSNGLVAVPGPNGSYRVQPIDGAAAQPGRIGSDRAAQNQFVTEIIRLRHIDAVAAVETLRPLVSPQGSLTANRNANSLVVADFADNIRRIRALASSIDRDTSTQPDRHVEKCRRARDRRGASGARSAAGEGAQASVAIVPIDSSNAIALRGDQALVARFVTMANDLDQKAAGGTELRVYWLEHANAETLLPTIQQLIGGGSDPAQKAAWPPATSSSSSSSGGD